MAKKSNFGNYSMIGKVFGGKPSARSRRQKKKDNLELGGIMLPALVLAGYFFYTKSKKGQTMTETITPNNNAIVKR
jgi:hypothetical protein